jgi:hypothetical protein
MIFDMESLRKTYREMKGLPLVGPVAIFVRGLFQPDWLSRRRLKRRDLATAHHVITEVFGADSPLHAALEDFRCSPTFSQSWGVGHSGDFDVYILHVLSLALTPEVVVETGVASGRSSAATLEALRKNGKGKLYSVDLPQHYEGDEPGQYQTHEGNTELRGFVPKGEQPGWLIPDPLRERWQLILGDSNVELPKLLSTLPKVDIFYHDGDHSYETMIKEFAWAWEKIPSGGFLLSDDTDWNTAWEEFCTANPGAYQFKYRHFGILRKK